MKYQIMSVLFAIIVIAVIVVGVVIYSGISNRSAEAEKPKAYTECDVYKYSPVSKLPVSCLKYYGINPATIR